MTIRKTLIILLLLLAPAVQAGERYVKKIIFKMTSEEFFKYDDCDFDSQGNVWLLNCKKGRIDVIGPKGKILRAIPVSVKVPPKSVTDEYPNAGNFHIRVDDCGHFIIFTDAFPTDVLEADEAGKIIGTGSLSMDRFQDVNFFGGNLYSRPDDRKVLSLSPVNCGSGLRREKWNDLTVNKNFFTPVSLSLPGCNKSVVFKDYQKAGQFLKVTNIIRDNAGNAYVTVENLLRDDKPDTLGEGYEVTWDTYKFDKNLDLLCDVPAQVDRINTEDETMFSVERDNKGDVEDFILEWWEKAR